MTPDNCDRFVITNRPDHRHPKLGFINSAGEEVIECQFEGAMNFYYGFASVSISKRGSGELWGSISTSGEFAVEPKYDFMQQCDEGGWSVATDARGFAGVVGVDGLIKIPFEYKTLTGFFEGKCGFQTHEFPLWGVMDKTRRTIIEPRYEAVTGFVDGKSIARLNGKYGIIDGNGMTILPHEYDSLGGPSGSCFIARLGNERGLLSLEGQWIFKTTFESLTAYREGLAVFSRYPLTAYPQTSGYLDMEGKIVLPDVYESARSFYSGLAAVSQNRKYRFIDKSGETIIPGPFEKVGYESFAHGLAYVEQKVGRKLRRGYINLRGEWVWIARQ